MKWLKTIIQYILAVLIAVVIAIALRLFAVDFYSIPSDSMEPAIEPGDFILVNKLSFGARLYKNFDFLESGKEPDMYRVKGFSKIHREDVLVFNFPYAKGWNQIKMHLSRFYVKRCIGIPGDTLAIRDGYYEINGKRGFGNMEDQQLISQYRGEFPRGIYHTMPFDPVLNWTIVNMGPLYLPDKGDRVQLDTVNARVYYKMIAYECQKPLRLRNGRIYCNDTLLTEHTFQKGWYFMGGDKMWNSQDSRYIGPIPEEFIIGKATWILSSKDPDTKSYHWSRFFKRIK